VYGETSTVHFGRRYLGSATRTPGSKSSENVFKVSRTPTTREGEAESLDVEECTRRALGSGSPPNHNAVEKNTLLKSSLHFFSVETTLCGCAQRSKKGNIFYRAVKRSCTFAERIRCAVSPLRDCCTMQRKSRGRVGDDPTKKYEKKICFDADSLLVSRRAQALVKKNTVVQRVKQARLVELRSKIDRHTKARIKDALKYSVRSAMSEALRETKIQIAWTTNIALVGPHQRRSSKKPDAAIYHARDLFTRYQDMYFSIVLCAGVKRSQPNSRQTLRVVSEKGGRRHIAASR